MSEKRVKFDIDNPEWTDADFARARYGKDIPADIREAFSGPPVGTTLAHLVAAQGAGVSLARLAA